jgi:hypothetical protein
MLKAFALFLIFLSAAAIEIRLLSNEVPGGRTEEVNPIRLTINSNGKYIYPLTHNTFSL